MIFQARKHSHTMIYMEEKEKEGEGNSHEVVTCGAPTEALAEAEEPADDVDG